MGWGSKNCPGSNISFEVVAKGDALDAAKVRYLVALLHVKDAQIASLKLDMEALTLGRAVAATDERRTLEALLLAEEALRNERQKLEKSPPAPAPKAKKGWFSWLRRRKKATSQGFYESKT